MKADKINAEIRNVVLEKKSLTLMVSVKLNFVMPKITERTMRERIVQKLGHVDRVSFKYVYEASEPHSAKRSNSGNGKEKKRILSGGVL